MIERTQSVLNIAEEHLRRAENKFAVALIEFPDRSAESAVGGIIGRAGAE